MKEYPKRTTGKLSLGKGKEKKEFPVEISCRSDGLCVIRSPKMEKLVFPKKKK